MKKVNKKYLAAAIISGGIATLPLVNSASAAESITSSDKIDVNLTAAASSIDFTITNGGAQGSGILMTVPKGSNNATVSNLTVNNNSTAVPIYVSNIVVDSSTTGYINKAYNFDYSASPIDSKFWGLAITKANSLDVSTNNDLSTGYTGDPVRDAIPTKKDTTAGSIVYTLSGKSSAYSSAVTEQKIGELKITVTAKSAS